MVGMHPWPTKCLIWMLRSKAFLLLEKKVVKEGATDFQNVTYLTKDKDSNVLKLKRNHNCYYQVLISLGLEWCDFFSNINNATFFCKRIMLAEAALGMQTREKSQQDCYHHSCWRAPHWCTSYWRTQLCLTISSELLMLRVIYIFFFEKDYWT